jgi:plasmid stabilization system protein ParE
MVEVRWTPQAYTDIEAIAAFIAHDSEAYAHMFVVDVLAIVDRISAFPELGRIVPETNVPVIRESLLGNYRIVYRLRLDSVEILTVHHGARLLDPAALL